MAGQTRQRKSASKELSAGSQDIRPDPLQPTESPSLFRKTWKRVVLRVVFICGTILLYNWYRRQDERPLATVTETIPGRYMEVPCSQDYKADKLKYQECVPKQCGRAVVDDLFTKEEVALMLKTAKTGMSLGGSDGGASILDLHSGALSKGKKFIDIYSVMEEKGVSVFTEEQMENYRNIRKKIQATISNKFSVPVTKLFLTKPTFFSKMTSKPAKTVHDEYWHVHVDKETYGSFHYTSLLYLTDYKSDFTGGRFIFVDEGKNTTVEPKTGRLSFFTSGSENPHYVEKVESGTRFAVTVSFTCDPKQAIADPSLERKTRHSS